MDALDRYQDLGSKHGLLGNVPAPLLIRLGPAVQQVIALGSRVVRPCPSPVPLPVGGQRIYLYHVRKTAGTSLVRSFLALGGEDPSAVERRIAASLLSRTRSGRFVFACGRGTVQTGDYFFGWSHMPSHRMRLRPGTFTVALLRDPVKRVVSYYRYLVSGDVTDDALGWRVQSDERALASDGFTAFLDRVPRELLLNQLYMFSRSFNVSEAFDRIVSCNTVMTTETYEQDLRGLASLTGLPLEVRRDRITAISDIPIEPDGLRRLQEMLEPEYELLERLSKGG